MQVHLCLAGAVLVYMPGLRDAALTVLRMPMSGPVITSQCIGQGNGMAVMTMQTRASTQQLCSGSNCVLHALAMRERSLDPPFTCHALQSADC